ncbi:lactate racemase domain-containing protein [Acidithrix sp. C25]|uniref:lactate racemase domain-containing protein n=1 Tax=Acidithrix sp. C25 TaxID=1671482 RepID=UPI00191B97C8|nr:lactate racemase domain-containing protein [Acidithrix sp. C25]
MDNDKSIMISNPGGIERSDLISLIKELAAKINHRSIAIVGPDFSRLHSKSGEITDIIHHIFGDRIKAIIPALGTHVGMSNFEKETMYRSFEPASFIDHDFIHQTEVVGSISQDVVEETMEMEGLFDLPISINRHLLSDEFDLFISIGQLLPHEVIGISGGVKNVLVGLGGRPTIEASHFLSALWGIERTLGNPKTAVRDLLNNAIEVLLQKSAPILFVDTVLNPQAEESKKLTYISLSLATGDSPRDRGFEEGARISAQTNIFDLPQKQSEIYAYLDPAIYKSTWIGNKAIYRTRLALGDDATLKIFALGIDRFGEEQGLESIIKRYGYHGNEAIELMRKDGVLEGNLAGAAHILHGSTFGRFKVEYYAPLLGRKKVEGVGFSFIDSDEGFKQPSESNLFEYDENGCIHIFQPGVALWRAKDV